MTHKVSLLAFAFLLLTCARVSAQFDKANKYFQKKEYAKAIPYYEQGLKEKESLLAMSRLAECYKVLNRTVQAESMLAEVVKQPRAKAGTYKLYAEVLMSNGKYAEAKQWFLDYFKLNEMDSTALTLAAACDAVIGIKPVYAVAHIRSAPFNSAEDDHLPVFGPLGLVFTSDRTQDRALLKQKSGATGRDFLKIWIVTPRDSTWSEPEHFSSKVNALNANTAGISFSPSGNLMAFSRNNTTASKKGEYKMHLYYSNLSASGRIGKPEKFDFCSDETNYMHPALFADGERIIFTSDSKGEGGMDLFMSVKRKDKWSVPRNLGPMINTARHEAFPFVAPDGRLFFASKGHAGLGGFDLFVSSFDTTLQEWTKPTNLGAPFNSAADDFSISFTSGMKAGSFATTRDGRGDDVYLFWLEEQQPDWRLFFKAHGSDSVAVQDQALGAIDEVGKSGDVSHTDTELSRLVTELNNAFVTNAQDRVRALVQQINDQIKHCPACRIVVTSPVQADLDTLRAMLSTQEDKWNLSLKADTTSIQAALHK